MQHILHAAEALVLLATLAVLLRLPFARWFAWICAAVGIAVFLWGVYRTFPKGNDLCVFYSAGGTVWLGGDPYDDENFINPPTALPIYASLAVVSFSWALRLWTAFNVLGFLLLVVLAHRALLSFSDDRSWCLPAAVLAILTPTMALSIAARYGLNLGQLSVFITLILLGALWAQAQGRPILAGFFLALATAKTGTLIPFLLLFLRKRDLWTWVALAGFCLLFCLLTTPPLAILERCRECLRNIAALSGEEGRFNDYGYTNASHAEFVSLDRAFYCLGFRDRSLIARLQLLGLAALGTWLAWRITTDKELPRPAAVAMVACYSCVFLYHRFYDLVILVIPLVYAIGRALREEGVARWFYSFCVVGILAGLYLRVGFLKELPAKLTGSVSSRLLEIVVMPYAIWAILGVLFCLVAAEHVRRKVLTSTHTSTNA